MAQDAPESSCHLTLEALSQESHCHGTLWMALSGLGAPTIAGRQVFKWQLLGALPAAFPNQAPCIFRCFYYFKKTWLLRNRHFSLTISVSNLVTEGKFSPSSHNYFLTLRPLFHLLNYVELFSLLFSKNASSVQCRNIYYLLSLYLLTFFLFRREEKMDQLWALLTVNRASSYSWIKQMLPDFKPVYIKAQYIYMSCIKVWSNIQLQTLPPIPLAVGLTKKYCKLVICNWIYIRLVETKKASNTFGKSDSKSICLNSGAWMWQKTANASKNSWFKALDLQNHEAIWQAGPGNLFRLRRA